MNYLYPEIKINATAQNIANETIFKIDTENIKSSNNYLKSSQAETVGSSQKPCYCSTTSCDSKRCGCFKNKQKCTIECHKNKKHENCLNCF